MHSALDSKAQVFVLSDVSDKVPEHYYLDLKNIYTYKILFALFVSGKCAQVSNL